MLWHHRLGHPPIFKKTIPSTKSNEKHLEAVYWVLICLKMTLGKGIFFQEGTTKRVEVYSDADWLR